jgi:4-diphosphocytidyl-2-C-methyl-D-erythritol kinase
MILRAPAKVNLYLKVLSKRPDGYHNIRTIFERIAIFDRIILRPLKKNEIKLSCDNPEVPTGKESLIYRAIDLLKKPSSRGVDVKILKRIPVAAGLGGGSSDAASVILGLNKLWKLSLGLSRLMELGKILGADIPFFLRNTSFAVAGERGDEIVPLGWKKTKFWHLVIYSPVKVLSKDIYSMYSKNRVPPPRWNRGSTGAVERGFLHNDLERVVVKKEPVVGRIKAALSRIGVKSLVSGSGPSVFSIFEKRKEAMSARDKLVRRFPFTNNKGWQIFIVPTL